MENKDWRNEVHNFLFQYRNTPHTVTGISPAELLGRRLKDKLPQVRIPADHATEADWQVLQRERDAMRQKQYADQKRNAQPSDINEGDLILLKQTRENKL